MSLREGLPMRFIPQDIDGLRRILEDERLSDDTKVDADEDTGLAEKTVGELRARSTWPRGLVVITPPLRGSPGSCLEDQRGKLSPPAVVAPHRFPPPWFVEIGSIKERAVADHRL